MIGILTAPTSPKIAAQAGAHRQRAADRHIGRRRHRKARRRKPQHQMVGILAHRQMLAFAHHVADVAEHEEIAGHGAREARDIVGIPGHQSGGKAPGKLRGGICLRDGIAHTLRQRFIDGDLLVARQFNEAVGEIGIACRQCRLDIFGKQPRAIPQGRIELEIRQFGRVAPTKK